MSKKTENLIFMAAGLGAVFLVLSRATLSVPGLAWSKDKVKGVAARLIAEHGFEVSSDMVAAIADVESDFNPYAVRYEARLGTASAGIMQTLLTTARWLAEDMGFDAYGVPSLADLFDGEKSIYFGLAYLHWLRTYGGRRRSDEWVVRSYNGGPGADNAMTAQYFEKYLVAAGVPVGTETFA